MVTILQFLKRENKLLFLLLYKTQNLKKREKNVLKITAFRLSEFDNTEEEINKKWFVITLISLITEILMWLLKLRREERILV